MRSGKNVRGEDVRGEDVRGEDVRRSKTHRAESRAEKHCGIFIHDSFFV